MTENTTGGEEKPRSLVAIRQARCRTKAKIAELEGELEELERLEAERRGRPAAMPDPGAARPGNVQPGIELARQVQGFTYPIDRKKTDRRFSNGLLNEVAEVFERHGFPEIQPGRDMYRLMVALYGFTYRREP